MSGSAFLYWLFTSIMAFLLLLFLFFLLPSIIRGLGRKKADYPTVWSRFFNNGRPFQIGGKVLIIWCLIGLVGILLNYLFDFQRGIRNPFPTESLISFFVFIALGFIASRKNLYSKKSSKEVKQPQASEETRSAQEETQLEAPIIVSNDPTPFENITSIHPVKLDCSSLPATLRRAFILIEDEEWEKADEYFEKVLDEEPENAYAYMGKALVETKVDSLEHISDKEICKICKTKHYARALKYADNDVKSQLEYWGSVAEVERRVPPIKQTAFVQSPKPPKERKHINPWLVGLLACLLAATAFVGFYFKKYSDTKTLVANGEYYTAKEDLFLPQLTKYHDPSLCNYIDALIALDAGNLDGYRTVKALADEKYPLAVNGLEAAKRLTYAKAIVLYQKRQYSKAREFFIELGTYNDCSKFLTLINSRNRSILNNSAYGSVGGTDVGEYENLVKIIGFHDANTILIDKYYDLYLKGEWRSRNEDYYLLVDDELNISCNVPRISSSGTYSFSDTIYYLSDGSKKVANYKITPISVNKLIVYSYKEGLPYFLLRKE